jgi:3-oxoacyl-[acyl-carrier-protein] synthase-3
MAESVRAAITGLGVAVPDKVLTNKDFEKFLDTSDEWITQRTGIKERHIVSDSQSTATIATQAARNALADARVKPKQLDLIICATITPDMTCPATACFVQQSLGAKNVPASSPASS